jgi:putative transposase
VGKCTGLLGRGQGAGSWALEALEGVLSSRIREVVLEALRAEVEVLCGAFYGRDRSTNCYRSGSAKGVVVGPLGREPIERPRVRRRRAGFDEEVALSCYRQARDPERLKERVVQGLRCGVSTRDVKRLDGEGSLSKSAASRAWAQASLKMLETFRSRSLERSDWLVLMLDGVYLAKDLWAIVALGIASDGTKHTLDLELGASESKEVAAALVERIHQRGFRPMPGCHLLAVLDGSKALRSGVTRLWPTARIQRCLVHKERNLRRLLSRRHHGELAMHMKRLRDRTLEYAEESLDELRQFLAGKSHEAVASLDEAQGELLCVHGLRVPTSLHKTLLSTNIIENSIRNFRQKTRRTTRWRAETDQPARWLAFGLLEAERGFRRVQNYGDLPHLTAALSQDNEVPPPEEDGG